MSVLLCIFLFIIVCLPGADDITVWEILPHQTTVQSVSQSVSRLYVYTYIGEVFFFIKEKEADLLS